jgi:hypothetical protein
VEIGCRRRDLLLHNLVVVVYGVGVHARLTIRQEAFEFARVIVGPDQLKQAIDGRRERSTALWKQEVRQVVTTAATALHLRDFWRSPSSP